MYSSPAVSETVGTLSVSGASPGTMRDGWASARAMPSIEAVRAASTAVLAAASSGGAPRIARAPQSEQSVPNAQSSSAAVRPPLSTASPPSLHTPFAAYTHESSQ
jgi:hypothetical protein